MGHSASESHGGAYDGYGMPEKAWPCAADWYAGVEDDRLLSHWAALGG